MVYGWKEPMRMLMRLYGGIDMCRHGWMILQMTMMMPMMITLNSNTRA